METGEKPLYTAIQGNDGGHGKSPLKLKMFLHKTTLSLILLSVVFICKYSLYNCTEHQLHMKIYPAY